MSPLDKKPCPNTIGKVIVILIKNNMDALADISYQIKDAYLSLKS